MTASPAQAQQKRGNASSRKQNPDATMSLSGHFAELRKRVIIALIGLLLGTAFGFFWYQHTLGPVSSLGQIMTAPYCSLPATSRADITGSGDCRLIATAPFDIFLLRIKVGAVAGLILSSPIWLGQLWRFITPGLKKNEKRWTITFVSVATLLFTLGAVLAYVVMFYGLDVLLTMGDSTQIAALSGQQYFSFLVAVILIFGVSFELPLLLVMLNLSGVLKYDHLKDKRRIIIMVLFVFAAFATPAQDPFTMSALALSLVLMVEVALQITRIHDKRKKKNQPAWLSASDEESTPLEQPEKISGTHSTVPPVAPRDTPSGVHTQFNTSESDTFDDVL